MNDIILTKDYPFKSKNDKVEIFVRLRGNNQLPLNINNFNERRREKNIMKEWVNNRNLGYLKGLRSPEKKPRSHTPNLTKTFSSTPINIKNKNKIEEEEIKKIKRKKNLTSHFLYYTFTSNYKSNKLIISQTPLFGNYITKKIKTINDLENINKNKLKESKIYEFDSVFNEQDEISDIYKQTIESKVKRMFNGFNSCLFIMGPKKSGKSYFLLGENKIKGILTHSINTILNYINLSKEDMICFYGISASYVVTISIEQIYLDFKDVCVNETIIFGIMNFKAILEKIKETRKKICEKYSITDLIRKSHLIINLTLYQNNTGDLNILSKKNNLEKLKELNDIQEISKFTFIEMNDSNYSFITPNTPIPKIYKETYLTYEEILFISIQLSRKIQPVEPTIYFMKYLYNNVISCGTNIIIFLCSNPCDPFINEEENILIWGFNLRNSLNYGIDISSSYHFENFNIGECKYINNCLFIEESQLEIIPKKNFKKKKIDFSKLLNKSKYSRIKSDESNELYSSFPTTYYQTLKDFENTTKELEKMKKEQKIERDNIIYRFQNLEKQVNSLKRKIKMKSNEF